MSNEMEDNFSVPTQEMCYILRFGKDPHSYTWTTDIDDLPELIEHYIAAQQFTICIQQDQIRLGEGCYECLNANTHELRVISETGKASGLCEQISSSIMKDGTLQPLFVWHRLTAELLYEALNPSGDWRKAPGRAHRQYEEATKTLNRKLSLCSQCGECVQLNQDGACLGGCNKEIFDSAQAIRDYTRFMNAFDHGDITPEQESNLELLTIQVKRQGLRFYYDHKQHIYGLCILEEHHD